MFVWMTLNTEPTKDYLHNTEENTEFIKISTPLTLCVCAFVFVYVRVSLYTSACGSQSSFLLSMLLMETGPFLSRSSHPWIELLAFNLWQRSLCLPVLGQKVFATTHRFLCGFWGCNPSPHILLPYS